MYIVHTTQNYPHIPYPDTKADNNYLRKFLFLIIYSWFSCTFYYDICGQKVIKYTNFRLWGMNAEHRKLFSSPVVNNGNLFGCIYVWQAQTKCFVYAPNNIMKNINEKQCLYVQLKIILFRLRWAMYHIVRRHFLEPITSQWTFKYFGRKKSAIIWY